MKKVGIRYTSYCTFLQILFQCVKTTVKTKTTEYARKE